MSHGHQPKHQGVERPAPPTSGSGVIPPSDSINPARVLAIYEDHIARLQEEVGSWRLAAEQAKAEKAALSARVDTLTFAMRNGRHAAMGGNAARSTAELLRWGAEYLRRSYAEKPYREPLSPDPEVLSERASMLEAADRMMHAALYPED